MTYKDYFYNALSAITENNGGNIEKALDYCGVSSEEDRCKIKKFYERFLAADDDEKFISIVNSPVNLEDFADALIANDIAFAYGSTGIYVYEESFDIAKNILKEMEEE